jgi:hypothetical protein
MTMLTVRQAADRYGVSTAFMIQALARISFNATSPETPLSTGVIARFEAEFGKKIRAKRPRSQPAFTAESDTTPTAARAVRQRKPHVMRVAHAKITGKRDQSGHRFKTLLDNPGIVHAIDAAGTWDGDPWSGEVVPGAVHFYGGPINSGPYAACGTTKVRAVLGDEFDPEDKSPTLCPRCVELVVEGKGFRTPPHERPEPFCDAYLRLRIDGKVVVEKCFMRDYHAGPHRTSDGAKWLRSVDDYRPAKSDETRHISAAS